MLPVGVVSTITRCSETSWTEVNSNVPETIPYRLLCCQGAHMARRGNELRDHILWVAKDVFLEMGFERASMDALAARAATSKRTLYAHFESKDKLFLAVVDLVGELYLDRLGTPEDYDEDTAEAVVRFCGRFL